MVVADDAGNLVSIARAPVSAFANKDVFLPAWFGLSTSRSLRKGQVKVVTVGPLRLALWRDAHGNARAFDARCPHLGADFAIGEVVGDELRCGLHHWRFQGDGRCSASPGLPEASPRCAPSFPVLERHGLVLVYPATRPHLPFPAMPDGDDERQFRRVLLPGVKLKCHHHLTTSNGLDVVHFEGLHDLETVSAPHFTVDRANATVHVYLHHVHKNPVLRRLGPLRSRFSAIGPSVAWVSSTDAPRVHALFVTQPLPSGGSRSQAVLYLPRGHPLTSLRVCAFLFSLLYKDDRQLDALADFRPAFVEADAPMRAYAELLEAWPRRSGPANKQVDR